MRSGYVLLRQLKRRLGEGAIDGVIAVAGDLGLHAEEEEREDKP